MIKKINKLFTYIFIYIANLFIDLLGNDFNWKLFWNSLLKTTIMLSIVFFSVYIYKKKK